MRYWKSLKSRARPLCAEVGTTTHLMSFLPKGLVKWCGIELESLQAMQSWGSLYCLQGSAAGIGSQILLMRLVVNG